MLLNPHLYESEGRVIKDSKVYMKEAGILNASRLIYVIRNNEIYNDTYNLFGGMYENVTVIQINLCAYKGVPFGVNVNADRTVVKNTYVYTGKCPYGEKIDFMNMDLYLQFSSSCAYGYIEDSDMYVDYGITLSSTNDSSPRSINLTDLELDMDLTQDGNLPIIDPLFYNEKHYELATGNDFSNLLATGRIDDSDVFAAYPNGNIDDFTYKGYELYDGFTTLYETQRGIKETVGENVIFKDKSLSLSPVSKSMYTMEKSTHLYNLILEMFPQVVSSMVLEFTGVYESGKGVNFSNIKYRKDFFKDVKCVDDFSDLKDKFKALGDNFTTLFGSVRILYICNQVSDSVRVLFDTDDIEQLTVTSLKSDTYERSLIALNSEYYRVVIDTYKNQNNKILIGSMF